MATEQQARGETSAQRIQESSMDDLRRRAVQQEQTGNYWALKTRLLIDELRRVQSQVETTDAISLDQHREHVLAMVRERQRETWEIQEQLGAIKDRVRHLVMVRLAMPNSPQEQEAWDALWEVIE